MSFLGWRVWGVREVAGVHRLVSPDRPQIVWEPGGLVRCPWPGQFSAFHGGGEIGERCAREYLASIDGRDWPDHLNGPWALGRVELEYPQWWYPRIERLVHAQGMTILSLVIPATSGKLPEAALTDLEAYGVPITLETESRTMRSDPGFVLKPVHALVLDLICANPGWPMTDYAHVVGTNAKTARPVFEELEAQGLIRRNTQQSPFTDEWHLAAAAEGLTFPLYPDHLKS